MIDQARLAESLGQLDAGTRALLDLSLRRAIPDEQVAKVLGVDAASIPPRRAHGIAQLADLMEVPGPTELAALLIAIPELPEDAWGVPEVAPFAGQVSRARRARAFRRVAVAASPVVALGAVLAAVLISTGSDNGGGSVSSRTLSSGTGPGGAAPQESAVAAEPRHGLPPGVQLTLARPAAPRHQAKRASHQRARHRHAPAVAEHAVVAREPSVARHTDRVVYHAAPVVRHAPRHVTHHHAPAAPKPAPAPNNKQPSTPAPAPAPAPQNPTVQVSAPAAQPPTSSKPPKPPVPQPNVHPWGGDGDDDGGGACGKGKGSSRGPAHAVLQVHGGRGNHWSPPGIFKRKNH